MTPPSEMRKLCLGASDNLPKDPDLIKMGMWEALLDKTRPVSA